jgi:DDE superfamily endonuclease
MAEVCLLIDQTIPQEKQIHLICDQYATHEHQKVTRWIDRHRRFHIYVAPTSASWLNMGERFLRDLTDNQLRRRIFRDLEPLILAIGNYNHHHNKNPKPFIWFPSKHPSKKSTLRRSRFPLRTDASRTPCSRSYESDGREI